MNHSLAWRLWQLFSNPPANNQLYIKTYHQPETTHAQSAAMVMSVLLGMFLLSGGVVVLVLFVPLLSPVVGAVWAYGLAGVLRRRVTPFTYLLKATPNGALGGYLNTAMGIMHRQSRFEDMVGSQVTMVRFVASGIITLPLIWRLILDPLDSIRFIWLVLIFFAATVLTHLMFLVVHIYCVQMGTLTALVAATFMRVGTIFVQLGAVLVYAFIHILTILALIVFTRAVYIVSATQTQTLAMLIAEALLLVTMALITEGTIQLLWRVLVYRLDASVDARFIIGEQV